MPTYDYRCNECGEKLEIFQSIKARPLKRCPNCGERGLERLIGAGAGIIFKGSGFYETDYRSAAYQADKQKDCDTAAKSSATTDKSSSKTGNSSAKTGGSSDKKAKAGGKMKAAG